MSSSSSTSRKRAKKNKNTRKSKPAFDLALVRADIQKSINAGDIHSMNDSIQTYLDFYAQHYDYTGNKNFSRDAIPNFFTVNVKKEKKSFDIVGQYFLPKETPKATALIVHGYYDHVGIYQHLIQHLLQQGIAVIAYDQPGHGLSSGKRASIESFGDYQLVLDAVIDVLLANKQLPEPYFLIGQSMGGAVSMEHMRRKQGMSIFDSTILFAPLVRPLHWNSARWLFHGVKQVRFIKKTPRQFSINSHDKEFLRFLQTDPLQPIALPVAWVNAMRNWFLKFEKADAIPEANFVSVIQAESDGTVNWEHNIPVIKRLFPDASVTMIKDARHQMVNESEPFRNKIFDALDKEIERTFIRVTGNTE